MADKLRSVNTRFWEDPFIEELNVSEKLLFLYLLTNSMTNILGIYEITIRRISYETGLNKEMVLKGLERFGTVRKAFFVDNYIILPNFLKNQNLNANMKKGVVRLFKELPNNIKDSILGNGSESFETVSNPYETIWNTLGKYEREIEYENEEEEEIKLNISFDSFWNLYNKKVGDKLKVENKWNKLKDSEREQIMKVLPDYISSTPDKQYRKNPETWINQRGWDHEIITKTAPQIKSKSPFV